MIEYRDAPTDVARVAATQCARLSGRGSCVEAPLFQYVTERLWSAWSLPSEG